MAVTSDASVRTPGATPALGAGRPVELFVLVVLAQLMASTQWTMMSVAVPDVVRDLDTTLQWASWAISLYTVMQAVSMPLMGRLSDTIGRRRVFLGGITLFASSSLACALAPNVVVLVVARGVQGIAAGSLLPSCYGVVGDAFHGAARVRMLGLISSTFPIGSVIGPNLGGFVVDHFGWRATFLVNLPVAVGVIGWAALRLPGPARADRAGGGRLDYVGAALLTASVGGLMYGLSELGRRSGRSVPLALACMALAVAAGTALVRRERRTANPLVDLDLLLRREFRFTNGLHFLYGSCTFSLAAFAPIYAQRAYGMTASQSGLMLTPHAVLMIVLSITASLILVRTGFRLPVRFGLTMVGLCCLLLAAGTAWGHRSGLSPVWYLALVMLVGGAGMGVTGPSINQAGLDLAPSQMAAVTGLRGMFRALGGAVSTACIALVATVSSTEARGLELSFLAVGLVSLAGLALVRGIPDRSGGAAPTGR